MKIKDVIQLEKNNENASRIVLVRDGMFWRAYEFSAMRFQKKIAPSFSVQARHFKNENVTLCYLGFPIQNLKAILQKAGYDLGVYNPQNQDVAFLEGFCVEDDFVVWKQQMVSQYDLPTHEKQELLLHPQRMQKNLSWLQLYKACYDLMVRVHNFSTLIKREHKYTIGERICNASIELSLASYRIANEQGSPSQQIPIMLDSIYTIRVMLRLLVDLKHLSLKSFSSLNEDIEYIYLEIRKDR